MTLCLPQTSEKTEKGNDHQSIEILKYIVVDVDMSPWQQHMIFRDCWDGDHPDINISPVV
jgi:hypothetical protein